MWVVGDASSPEVVDEVDCCNRESDFEKYASDFDCSVNYHGDDSDVEQGSDGVGCECVNERFHVLSFQQFNVVDDSHFVNINLLPLRLKPNDKIKLNPPNSKNRKEQHRDTHPIRT